ncbi:MAG: bifunctional diaminohydroxyphosphoribosylaminopyrimidine deaminase/5-amino-6-(5-phosphoribosylamino)uracil reductase RibD, partial [Moraxellaceae bacterium]|nr:bifunctional diaminohydroxyphosphoribosylaminopyrimidine deaminase/5-amino-6-(5-phosphoribosylamino)uracil reductase RibD [Pseudobdellovibrionaceae bacterium]
METKEIDFSLINIGDTLSDDQAMALAIHIAKAGAPFVSPNPLVGCTILNRENKLIATGFHQKYGEAHAEINAIKNLSASNLENTKVFVTLEPCAHEGKTGSCAKKLIQYKIKKLIYGLVDPNPLVSGQGAAILQASGIEAEEYQGYLKADLNDLCEVFLKNFRQKKTFVAMKVASSLDGQIALSTGESKWITTTKSREYVHELRSYYDAILVGSNTIEMDNPSLNIRHSKIQKERKLIILDPESKLAGKKYKFQDVHKPENIHILRFNDLNDVMNQLWALNIKSVFIEGGAQTYSSFLKAGLVDRLYLFMNAS